MSTRPNSLKKNELLQLDLPVVLQSSVTSCALATVSGVVWYLTGRHIRQRDLAGVLGQRWTKDGTRMADVIGLVQRFAGVAVDEQVTTTFATVTAAIQAGQPMLAAVHVDADRGHMIAVVGVVIGATPHVVVNDPNFRWRLLIPWPEFCRSLRSIAFVRGHPAISTGSNDNQQPPRQASARGGRA